MKLHITLLCVLLVLAKQSSAQDGEQESATAHCQNEDSAAVEALHARGPYSVERMAAFCSIEGGPLHGTRMTTATVYLLNKGKGKLITGYAKYGNGDTTAVVEVLEGSITKSEGNGWSAQGRDFYKIATGRAASLEGTVVNWAARNKGAHEFVVRSQFE
jgi:hypothetical protein